MKKSLILMLLVLWLCPVGLMAQSDKDILKDAKAMLDRKAYDSAFFMVITAKKVKSGKVQGIIKKAYPGLVSANVRKANKIKIGDKEDGKVKCEKIQSQINIILVSKQADSLLNLNVKEEDYKSLSKKRSIDKSISTFTAKLQAEQDKLAKIEAEKQRIADSTAEAERIRAQFIADSLAALEAAKDTIKQVVVLPVDPGSHSWFIIAGNYPTKEWAQSEADKLKAQGFPNARVVNQNNEGNWRICYCFYATRQEAENNLPQIRRTQRPDAWILEY